MRRVKRLHAAPSSYEDLSLSIHDPDYNPGPSIKPIKKVKMAKKRNTVIWEYYSYDSVDFNSPACKDKFQRAICKQPGCATKVARPASSTTGMKNHLEIHHPAVFVEYLARLAEHNMKKARTSHTPCSSSEDEIETVEATDPFAVPSLMSNMPPMKWAPPAKKRNTVIWEYYSYDPDDLITPNTKGKFQRVVCKQPGCGVRVPRPAATTTGMKNHLELHHPEKYNEYLAKMAQRNLKRADDSRELWQQEQDLENGQEHTRSQSVFNKRPATAPADQYLKKRVPVKYHPMSDVQKRTDLDVMIYLATANLPFSHVETEAFKRLVESLSPKANILSQSDVSERLCPLLYKNLESGLVSILEKDLPTVDGCAFTTDLWVNQASHSYISLSIQYISMYWEMRRYTIESKTLEEHYTEESLGTLIDGMITRIPGLQAGASKILTTDADSNISKGLNHSRMIDKHLPCLDQILNECLKKAFSVPEVSGLIQKCKELAAFSHKSIKAMTKIRAKCEALEVPFTNIHMPDNDRWNSVTECLESILKIRGSLIALLEDNDPQLGPLIPSGSHLDSLQELLHPLKLIKTTSEKLQADSRPSIHLALSSLINIGNMSKSRQFQQSGNTTRAFVEAFEQALSSRLTNFGREVMEYNVANFLHPTFKGSLLKYNKDSHSYDKTCQYIRSQFPEDVEPLSQELPVTYSNPQDQATDESGWGALDLAREEVGLAPLAPQTKIDRELEVWRDTVPATTDVNIDILGFWKAQEEMLPCLAKLARRILALPMTSSSSKRTLVNTDQAEELIFIQENYDRVTPMINHWSLDIEDFRDQTASESFLTIINSWPIKEEELSPISSHIEINDFKQEMPESY